MKSYCTFCRSADDVSDEDEEEEEDIDDNEQSNNVDKATDGPIVMSKYFSDNHKVPVEKGVAQ